MNKEDAHIWGLLKTKKFCKAQMIIINPYPLKKAKKNE